MTRIDEIRAMYQHAINPQGYPNPIAPYCMEPEWEAIRDLLAEPAKEGKA